MSDYPTRFSFTHRSIAKLPACPADSPSSSAEYSDVDVTGLKLQISKTGRKFFYFRYTHGGVKRVARIGEFPAIDVADARKSALTMRAQVDRGEDPQAQHDAMYAAPTFKEFGEQQYMPHARQYKRSHDDDESRLRLHLYPRFGHCKMSAMTTRDIQILLNEKAKTTSNATANRVRALLSKMFKLAMLWNVVERDPSAGVSKFREPRHADRFLSPDEAGRFIAALAQEPNRVAAEALRLLLLTGLRRNEVLKAKWEQVDLEGGMIYLPVTKSGKPRYAVLNSKAKELVEQLPSKGHSLWLFPGGRGGTSEKPLDNPTKVMARVLRSAGIDHMRIHDLRHSFASLAVNSGGATLFEVQTLLGHSSPAMSMRYAHLASDTIRRASEGVATAVSTAVDTTSATA